MKHSLLSVVLVLAAPLSAQAPSPVHDPKSGVWVSDEELLAMPMEGTAWDRVLADASGPIVVDLGNQNHDGDSLTMAAGLVYRRLLLSGDVELAETYRQQLEAALVSGMGTESPGDGSTLPPSRNLCAFVIGADLLEGGWSSPELRDAFRTWCRDVLDERLGGRTVRTTHEGRPNNWGTHAGASRAAIARYLGDDVELARCAQVFKGWLGDRTSYADFDFGDLSWQSNPEQPRAVNPLGARLLVYLPAGGILPEEQRRCEEPRPFPDSVERWLEDPEHVGACQTNYGWEAMQGVLAQAIILRRAGYDPWRWERKAIGRAAFWLIHWNQQPPQASINGSDDRWQSYVLDSIYPALRPMLVLQQDAPHGKAVGYTPWTTLAPTWLER